MKLSLAAPAVTRRGLPAPWDAPPFPGTDFIGPVIGAPAEADVYPLMRWLKGGEEKARASRVKAYGWLNGSVNFSTSKRSNFPQSYTLAPNELVLNQLILRVERQPDTVQTDHFDWGFRVSNLLGHDYRFTTAKGFLSDQLLKDNDFAGFDIPELYGMLYFPKVAEGMVLKVGRFISPPDIEAQLAPDNYLFSHSVMFTFDAYTQTGLQANVRLNDNWTVLGGVHAGNDTVPWDEAAALTGQAGVRWVADDNNDSIYAVVASLGKARFKKNKDLFNEYVLTWTHRFNRRLHSATEVYFLEQFDALVGGTVNFGPPKRFYAFTGAGALIPGQSSALGLVNYTNYKLSEKDYMTFRTDFMNDFDGQRSGFDTRYESVTLGLSHQVQKNIIVRPEIRYERSLDLPVYDSGTKQNQTLVQSDIIMRF